LPRPSAAFAGAAAAVSRAAARQRSRKLLNRLNLEALAQTDRSRAEGEIRTLLGQLLAEEATPINLSERETLFRRDP
jgi:hypothetical protein